MTLTITDDDAAPTVTLVLSPSTINESGARNSTGVRATLSHPSSQRTSITVSVTAVSPAVAGDFFLDLYQTTLAIAAGSTTSTYGVSITARDNSTDAPDKTFTVSGTATNSVGIVNPDDVTLTITDDDDAPTVTLVLSPSTINESGASNVSTVTATLNHPSSQATTITVAAAAGANTVSGDFALSSTTTLTIAAGSTTSTGTVTITAVDNAADEPNKTVTVSATAANSQGTRGQSVEQDPDNRRRRGRSDRDTCAVTVVDFRKWRFNDRDKPH